MEQESISRGGQQQAGLLFEITEHAGKRMDSRHISDDDVRYIVENKESMYDTRGDTVFVGHLPDGRFVKVRVFDPTSNPMLVVDVVALA